MNQTTTVVCVHECGVPEDAVRVEQWALPALEPQQVLIRVHAAPINPADLNVLEGTYGIHPNLPAVLGNEGVGEIIACGSAVTGLSVGQAVIARLRMG